jgi:hypothetical protein
MGMRKEAIKTEGCKLLLDAFQFVGISRQLITIIITTALLNNTFFRHSGAL